MKKLLGIVIFGLLLGGCNEVTLYYNTAPSENIVVYAHIDNPDVKYTSSSTDQLAAQKSAANKCEASNQNNKKGCLRYSTSTRYSDGKVNEYVGWDKAIVRYKKWESEGFPSTSRDSAALAKEKLKKKIEDEKKRIAKAKKDQTEKEKNKRETETENKKKEEEKRIAQAKKKKEEDAREAQAKKKKEEQEKSKLYVIGSGTGFFVSSEGHIVSNDHVVGICRSVAAKIDGEIINFNVINTDKVNDLGLIKGDYKPKKFLSIKTDGAEFGEDIVAFGYPLSDALSTSVKLTRGIVSSLSGPGNNYSEIQIDAAIQPGNSGGPVLNMEGQVVGVASSGLNKLYMLESSEYIPENVNFAVAAPTLSNFLKANGVFISNTSMKISNTKELAKIGRPATLQLFCMNTKAAYQKLKNKKKHNDVLLEKVVELR